MAGSGRCVRYWLLTAFTFTSYLKPRSVECSMIDLDVTQGREKSRSACFVLLCGPQEFAKRRRPFAGFLSGLFDHIQLDLV